MSILNKILHPIKSIEQWAFNRFLEKVLKQIPESKRKLAELWEQHKEEIYEKVKKAIKKAITDFIAKKMEEQRNKVLVESDN